MDYPLTQIFRFILVLTFAFFAQVLFPWSALCDPDIGMAFDFRRQALQAQEQGKPDLALFYFDRASVLDPGNPALRNDKGLVNEYLGNRDKAEADYRKAISLDPEYLPAYYNLGCLYLNERNYDLALEYLNKRVQKGDPTDEWTLKAQEKIDQVFDAVPYYYRRSIISSVKEMEENITRMKEASKIKQEKQSQTAFQTAYQKGIFLLEQRRYNDAVLFLKRALAVSPRNPDAALALRRAMYGKERSALEERATIMQQRQGKKGRTRGQSVAREQGLARYLDRVAEQRRRVSRTLDVYGSTRVVRRQDQYDDRSPQEDELNRSTRRLPEYPSAN